MPTRRHLLQAAALLPVALAAVPAWSAEPPVFQSGGVAINGYDPVAYFTEGKPVEGDAGFSAEWEGATFLFSSAENKATFESDPAAYAPQYGGYCAYAVSQGYTAKTEPEAWTVRDGKLYLNYSLRVRTLWSEDPAGYIAAADANWPEVLE